MERMRFTPQGTQEVTPHRQQRAMEDSERVLQYAINSQTHVWIVALAHRASDGFLDALDGKTDETSLLDADTLWMAPTTGCFVCEEPYEPRMRYRKCPGQPRRA